MRAAVVGELHLRAGVGFEREVGRRSAGSEENLPSGQGHLAGKTRPAGKAGRRDCTDDSTNGAGCGAAVRRGYSNSLSRT